MRIVIDWEVDAAGYKVGEHCVNTEVPGTLAALVTNFATPSSMNTSGWAQICQHPNYIGQTRHQVFLAEIVRLNDAAARAQFGV